MIENPAVQAQERHNNRIQYRPPIEMFDPCECGRHEAAGVYKGKQRLCIKCLEGICEVTLL